MSRALPVALLLVVGATACATTVQETEPGSPAGGPASVAGASTVAVGGTACGVAVAGSGFVAAPGLVVTAAHVVAGVDRPAVTAANGTTAPAEVVAVDPARDLAVLAVDADLGPPLGHRDPAPPEPATVLARSDSELRATSVTLADAILARGPDIRGDGEHVRSLGVLAGDVRPGASGAPVVGEDGHVLGVVVATSTEQAAVAYAVSPAELDAVLAAVGTAAVPTGACLS